MKQVSQIGELRRETVAEVCGLPYWELCYENDGADLDADAQQYRLDVRTAAEYLLGVGAKLDERATANDVLRAASDYAADRLGKFPEGRATVGEVMEAAGRELMGAMERIRLEGDGPVGMERDTATVLLNAMYSRTVAAATAMQDED